jgi:regulator of RNase E activity RraB
MSDHWEFYPRRIGDRAAFIFYDHDLGETIDQLALPTALKIRVQFEDPSDNGLPKQSEFERLSALEDALGVRITAAGGIYAGRITTDGARYFHCFVALEHDAARRLIGELQREWGYELAFSLEPDLDRTTYWEELFPSSEEWRVIQDMKVLEALKGHGDDPSIARRIDHWLYFPQRTQRDRFATWAERNGFSVDNTSDDGESEVKYGLQIYHTARPELQEISAMTRLLLRKAQELHGDYDGWETSVCKL